VFTTHPHPAPRLKEEYSYTSAPPLGFRGLFQGEFYLYYMYVCGSLSSPVSEVKYEFINKSVERSNIAPNIKELTAKIQQNIYH
jgi:hypothetical protein